MQPYAPTVNVSGSGVFDGAASRGPILGPARANAPTDERLLSPVEERRLIERAQGGDDRARERLVEMNMRLVYSIARRYRCRSLMLDDLVQEGAIGLLMAIDRFDMGQGCRLATYATHWIRQSITRAVERGDRLIRLPVQASGELRQVENARAALQQRLNREPDVDEIAAECGFSSQRVSDLLGAIDPVSLDTLIGPDQEVALSEVAVDEDAVDPEAGTLAEAGGHVLRRVLERLDARERRVVEMRYGLSGQSPLTLKDVSVALGISREGARQIEVRALARLRYALHAEEWD